MVERDSTIRPFPHFLIRNTGPWRQIEKSPSKTFFLMVPLSNKRCLAFWGSGEAQKGFGGRQDGLGGCQDGLGGRGDGVVGRQDGLDGRQDHFHKVPTLFFHQVGQIWSYRALVKAFGNSPRDLAFGYGFRACSLKNRRKLLNFHTFGKVEKRNKKRKSWTISVECSSPEL